MSLDPRFEHCGNDIQRKAGLFQCVMPAKAGIQDNCSMVNTDILKSWIPA